MKYILFSAIFFLFVQRGFAQETIEITYASQLVSHGTSIVDISNQKFKANLYWHCIVTGDTSYTFATFKRKPSKKFFSGGKYGNRSIHHSRYFMNSSQTLFEVVNFKGNYMIEEQITPDKIIWIDSSTNILGYECQAAFAVTPSADTAVIWLSRFPDEKRITNHFGYTVPGLVMASLDLSNGRYYRAVQVRKTNNKIVFPADLPVLSVDEHRKRRREL